MTKPWISPITLTTAHLLALSLLACNQPSPPGADDGETSATDGSTDGSADSTETGNDTGVPEDGSLYPLVDGATWTSITTSAGGQVLGMDTVTASETTWMGMQAWDLTDDPNANGNWDVSTIIRNGDLALRVHRVENDANGVTAILDYDPGFLRASDGWTEVGQKEEFLYDRTEYDAMGQNPMVEARGHTFEVLAIDEEVTVPAGTFNCVKVERVRTVGTEAGTLVRYWFAPGVGKVREERPIDQEIEELVSVSIPGGAQLP